MTSISQLGNLFLLVPWYRLRMYNSDYLISLSQCLELILPHRKEERTINCKSEPTTQDPK